MLLAVRIREYQGADRDAIAELVANALHEIFGTEAASIEDSDRVGEEFCDNLGAFFVAEHEGKLVGSVALRQEASGTIRLKRMYADRLHGDNGIGGILLRRAVQFAEEKDYHRLVLSTHPRMTAALAFHRKHGFREHQNGALVVFERRLIPE